MVLNLLNENCLRGLQVYGAGTGAEGDPGRQPDLGAGAERGSQGWRVISLQVKLNEWQGFECLEEGTERKDERDDGINIVQSSTEMRMNKRGPGLPREAGTKPGVVVLGKPREERILSRRSLLP